ncbi:flagellar basal body L-ring protein FlgH [Stieleria sp. JC731]|uniref:flagellar basal body L-ring protein FlgH n=1 Tax=Pirellulaceae TaxID=2691357 RepID=UPI001E60DBE7|nr:flagellar basal body L-ring protein FlgH [Stieleria sp. JC731]MCC9602946.1 flagellar basal body L-ring protein FlgH [Stieleria sp. JC731]
MIQIRLTIFTWVLTWMVATVLWCQHSPAQSLFERRSANQIDQYRDYVARQRGDTLTVMVAESTDVENRDERVMDKQGQSSSSQGFDYAFGGDVGTSTGDAFLGTNSANQRGFSGDAEFRSARAISDQFGVTVVDVLPNGNLVLEGFRSVSVQGDVRRMRLTGVVRQYDILPGNMVPSNKVADLRLTLDAEGAEQAFTSQGWLSSRINRLWPF